MWCSSRKEVQTISEMLMGACGAEQDSADELWEAAQISVWNLFRSFFFLFFFFVLAVSAHLRSVASGQAILSAGSGEKQHFNLLLHHVV